MNISRGLHLVWDPYTVYVLRYFHNDQFEVT
jgi:hypothetical protein